MSISIRKEENGFVLTNHCAGAVQPTWVFQGHSEEKVDEMLAQAKLILLEEPDVTPPPDLFKDKVIASLENPTMGDLPLSDLLPDETPPPNFGVDPFMRDEAPNETQI